jgi:hypothetical protein
MVINMQFCFCLEISPHGYFTVTVKYRYAFLY